MKTILLDIEMSRTPGRGFISGIVKFGQIHGGWRYIYNPPFYAKSSRFDILKNMRTADGVMTRDIKTALIALKLKIPCIVLFQSKHVAPHLKYIVYDNDVIAEMASEHLLRSGHKEFAYCGYKDMQWSIERAESFSTILSGHTKTVHAFKFAKYIKKEQVKKEEVRLIKWLQKLPLNTAIFACNDDMALQVMQSCKVAGLQVPDQLSLIGVDNDHMVSIISDVPISSISINFEKGGFDAACMLQKMFEHQPVDCSMIVVRPTSLLIRKSSQPPFGDPQIAVACDFIRLNSHKRIGVMEVVENSLVSRRSLEMAFRKHLGHSIHDEITTCQLEKICYMLKETNLSLTQIALFIGYDDIKQICRIFRKYKNMTPTSYRKLYRNVI